MWQHLLDLPKATTPDLEVRRALPVPMGDGVTLLADLYRPRDAGPLPTVLVRTPYGRRGLLATISARLLAERGLQVLLQSCRGTFGSGGTLEPFRERDDGLQTLEWIRQQSWHAGRLGIAGTSYLGIAKWALAAEAGPDLAAIVVAATSSNPRDQTYPGGSFALELALGWAFIASVQEAPFGTLRKLLMRNVLHQASYALPLSHADKASAGTTVPFYQQWLAAHDAPTDPYWNDRVFSDRVGKIEAAVDLVAGWYDIFLPGQLKDYRRLADAGRKVHLTVGPWAHVSLGLTAEATRRAIKVLRSHLVEQTGQADESAVRIYVTGIDEWRELPDWPPPATHTQNWHLDCDRGLSPALPRQSEPDAFRYDPADPTPAFGGSVLFGRSRPNNARLEARADVLTFTSAPLKRPLEVIGEVSAKVYLASNRDNTDLFVRLCDVEEGGVSRHVCDGLQRVTAASAPITSNRIRRVDVELWPTAHVFAVGHRLRVQISSGAHPRYARNPGTGKKLGEETELLPADQLVYHDPRRPSAIFLPITKA